MIAAWHVRPPRLVTIAAARFITGSQFGSVMSVTSTSPGCTCSISCDVFDDAHRTDADLLADRAAGDQHVAVAGQPEALLRVGEFDCDFTVSGRACRM